VSGLLCLAMIARILDPEFALNPRTYERMKENLNTGAVVTGEKSLQGTGKDIYQEILAVASGKIIKGKSVRTR
jgi:altronate dehydratase